METLFNSEFPQYKEVLSFSLAYKPLKMEKKMQSHLAFSYLDYIGIYYSRFL